MTEQEINQTIATHIFDYEDYDMLVTSRHHNKRELFGAKKKDDNWTLVPNYCGDLNEMREAERLLDEHGVFASFVEQHTCPNSQ